MARGKTRGSPTRADVLIGERLRQARQLAGISQSELAAAVDVTFQQVQKYEKGQNRIAASRLLQFSIFFGRTVDWFLLSARDATKSEGARTFSVTGDKQAEFPDNHKIYKAGKIICDIQNPKIRSHILGLAKEINTHDSPYPDTGTAH